MERLSITFEMDKWAHAKEAGWQADQLAFSEAVSRGWTLLSRRTSLTGSRAPNATHMVWTATYDAE